MKRITAALLCVMLLLCASGCSLLPFFAFVDKNDGDKSSQDEEFEKFMEDEFIDTAGSDTVTMHFLLTDPEKSGVERPEVSFGSGYELADYEEGKDELKEFILKLDEFDESRLSEDNARRLKFLREYAENKLELYNYPQFDTLLDAQYGVASNLPSTLTSYKFYCEQDVEDYLELLGQIPDLFKKCLAFEADKDDEHRMAQFTIDNTIEQIDVFLKGNGDALIDTFKERIDGADFLTQDKANEYISQNEKLVNHTVVSAYKELKSGLEKLDAGKRDKGLSHYKDGKEYYAQLLKSMTYSDKSPEEMSAAFVARYNSLVDRLTALSQSYNGDVFSLFGKIDFGEYNAKDILKDLCEKSDEKFPEMDGISYTVDEIPEVLRQENTLAYYVLAPLDAQTDNEIYYKPDEGDDAEFFMTLAHEGYPGHMYQWNYLLKNDEPRLLMSLDTTGLMEGWAMYSQLSSLDFMDCGKYDKNAVKQIYSINTEFNYLICSLADLLVNHYGDDREELYKELSEMGVDRETSDDLYESSIDTPGLYLRYYMSCLELLTLREDVYGELKKNFDEKEFNRAVLDAGICYFDQLNEVVAYELTDEKAAA